MGSAAPSVSRARHDTVGIHAPAVSNSAGLRRGGYMQSEYRKVISLLSVLRSLACVIKAIRQTVLSVDTNCWPDGLGAPSQALQTVAGKRPYNTPSLTITKFLDNTCI
jgi:hypothetical protein